MARTFSIVFLALALAITGTYRENFFATPHIEEGDSASNGLQIHRAKRLREIHGNYSQWGFHHPGPAFFYVHAAGEWLLHDTLRLTPAPHNAHLYTGALLQLAFYAAAIALLARHTRQPALTVALAIATGALHFAQVDRIIYSTWPPDVLLMPMLCFLVACAAVASGDRIASPFMVVAGSFLVHGHVAQPLFVVPMTLAAVIALLRNPRFDWRKLAGRPSTRVSFVLLAVFLLPLVIDASRGRASNLHDIVLHLRYQHDAGQSLLQSALCYASYFLGMNDPSLFNRLGPEAWAPFARHLWLIVAWAAAISVVGWWFFSGSRRRESIPPLRFGRSLLWFWLLASALTLVWGMRQDGGLTSYNSHFNHSLVHALALAVVVMAGQLSPTVSRLVCTAAGTAAVAAFALALPAEPKLDARCDDIPVRLPALLAADARPAAPKLLLFAHEDWYEAVTLARALQHRGLAAYVHPDHRIMFGRDLVFGNQHDALHRGALSVWRIVPASSAPSVRHVLNRNCRVVFVDGAPAATLPLHIDFSRPGPPERFALFGLAPTEPPWTWTDAHFAALTFTTPAAQGPLLLSLDASGLTTELNPAGQTVRLVVNGHPLATEKFPGARHTLRATIPAEIWNARSSRLIVLELPDALAPAKVGLSADRRLLGLRLYGLTLEPLGEAR
ncbi:MAG: hypothetical protein HZA93_00885 [Verrucomicrobia bacterium]|nr:hypothetical protein [Verrucomicrobiota bacterium]